MPILATVEELVRHALTQENAPAPTTALVSLVLLPNTVKHNESLGSIVVNLHLVEVYASSCVRPGFILLGDESLLLLNHAPWN